MKVFGMFHLVTCSSAWFELREKIPIFSEWQGITHGDPGPGRELWFAKRNEQQQECTDDQSPHSKRFEVSKDRWWSGTRWEFPISDTLAILNFLHLASKSNKLCVCVCMWCKRWRDVRPNYISVRMRTCSKYKDGYNVKTKVN